MLKRRDSTIEAIEMLGDEDIMKVKEFVDDDLLSCFLWAAGENAIAQPDWRSPFSQPHKAPLDNVPSLALPPATSSIPTPADISSISNSVPALASTALAAPAPATKRAEPTAPLSKEDKTAMRMKRKAESARVARLRKKEYVAGLEDQIKALQTEVERLRNKTDGGGDASDKKKTVKDEEEKQLCRMDALLRRRSLEQLTPEVNATVESFVQNKRKRQDIINDHLDCILELLSPGENLQFAFGGAQTAEPKATEKQQQPAKRQRVDSIGSNLLEAVAAEIGLTPTQTEDLNRHRQNTQRDREILVTCEHLCNELRARISEHIVSSQGIMDGLRRILTPVQVAKFLMWVEKNQKSMEMMNSFNWELQLDSIDALDDFPFDDDEAPAAS